MSSRPTTCNLYQLEGPWQSFGVHAQSFISGMPLVPYLEMPDGTPIHYVDEGSRTNRALLLIPGEPLSCWFWQRNISELARYRRVVAIDVRGRGRSGKTEHGHNITQFARDLHEIVQALGLETVVGVGWSLGGSILWSYVEQFGQDVLGGFVNVDQQPYRFVSEEHLRRLLDEVRLDRLAFHTRRIRYLLGPEFDQDERIIKRMAYECMMTPTLAHLATLEDTYRRDFRATMSRTRVPTQIFCARYGLINPSLAEEIRSAVSGDIVFFEHSGHLLPWTEPERFNAQLIAFSEGILA